MDAHFFEHCISPLLMFENIDDISAIYRVINCRYRSFAATESCIDIYQHFPVDISISIKADIAEPLVYGAISKMAFEGISICRPTPLPIIFENVVDILGDKLLNCQYCHFHVT